MELFLADRRADERTGAPSPSGLLAAAGLTAVAFDHPTLGSTVVTIGVALALGAGPGLAYGDRRWSTVVATWSTAAASGAREHARLALILREEGRQTMKWNRIAIRGRDPVAP